MLITLTGDNDYQVAYELHRLVDEYVSEYTDLGLERLDANDVTYEKIIESLNSLPFLTAKKLAVITGASGQKLFTENFKIILDSIPDTTDVIFVEKRIDKRFTFYKDLKKFTDFRDHRKLDPAGLAIWAVSYSMQHDGKLSKIDAQYLVDRVGLNQLIVKNELDKLLNYDLIVTKKNIKLLTEQLPQTDVFNLIEAAFKSDKSKAIKIYNEQRMLKVEPQMIVGMLIWQLHLLSLVKTSQSQNSSDIASRAKVNPYVVTKTQNLARIITDNKLKQLIQELLNLDIKLKTSSVDIDEAMQLYILKMSD